MSKTAQGLSTDITELPCKNSGNTLRSIPELESAGVIEPEQQKLQRVAERFSVAITPQMLDLIDPTDTSDPIASQFIPQAAELETTADELLDPIGDHSHSPLPGIVHRYPDRLLLMPVKICPVYCRFCFRREDVGKNINGTLSPTELDAAIAYIQEHTEVWEVILSGGDPLLMSARRLKDIIDTLAEIDHVKIIRVHTRVPVVDPQRITTQLVNALRCNKAVYVVVHSNHPREMTAAAKTACALLVDNGIPLLSQTVLLKDINDDPATLEALMRVLVENRVKPYYLHHADRAQGTGHFRTRVAEGQALIEDLRGRVSGLCQPQYVLDIPGGAGKIPIGASWIRQENDTSYTVRDIHGNEHQYMDTAGTDVESTD